MSKRREKRVSLIFREALLLLVATVPFALADYYTGSGYSAPYGGGGYGGGYGGGFGVDEGGYSPIISFTSNPKDTVRTSLRIAARTDRLDEVKRLIEQEGADVDSRSEAGSTALMHSAQNCSPKLVQYLAIEKKANVNLADRHGRTALMYAAMDSCLPVVEVLTKVRGIQIQAQDNQSKTAMEYAGTSFQIKDVLKAAIDAQHRLHLANKRASREREPNSK